MSCKLALKRLLVGWATEIYFDLQHLFKRFAVKMHVPFAISSTEPSNPRLLDFCIADLIWSS